LLSLRYKSSLTHCLINPNLNECPQSFFAKRAFQIFDKDNSGKVSIAEYRETLEQFSNQSVEEKVRFLFQIYDQDSK